ncbi:MAG: protein-L-isoaspartate O-methyltransferase family protein [Promethearchaeota archaeon]
MGEKWNKFKKIVKERFGNLAPALLKYGVPIIFGISTGGMSLSCIIPPVIKFIKERFQIKGDERIDKVLGAFIEKYSEGTFKELKKVIGAKQLAVVEEIHEFANNIQELRVELKDKQDVLYDCMNGWVDEFGKEMAKNFEITWDKLGELKDDVLAAINNLESKVDNVQDSVDHIASVNQEQFAILVEKITELSMKMEIQQKTQEEQSSQVQVEYKKTTRRRVSFQVFRGVDNDDSRSLRNQMVRDIANNIHHQNIINPRILQAMKKVPRHIFANLSLLVKNPHNYSLMDRIVLQRIYDARKPMPITRKFTASAPDVVAIMMSLFNITPGDKILFIGAKGGYIQSIAAEMVGASGKIVVLSLDEQTLHRNEKICEENTPYGHMMSWEHTQNLKDVRSLLPLYPFNCIFVCGRVREIPREYLALLDENGCCVAPVGSDNRQAFTILYKKVNRIRKNVITDFQFVFGPPI